MVSIHLYLPTGFTLPVEFLCFLGIIFLFPEELIFVFILVGICWQQFHLLFCLFANVFVSLSLLEDIFGGYKTLRWQLSFSNLKMSFHYLSFIITIEKSTIILISVIWNFFCLFFSSFAMMWLVAVFFDLMSFNLEILCLYFFNFFSCPVFPLRCQLGILFYSSYIKAINFLVFHLFYSPNFNPNTFWYFFQITYPLFIFQYSL